MIAVGADSRAVSPSARFGDDHSICLTPHYQREFSFDWLNDNGGTRLTFQPGQEFHFSLTEAGIVNVTAGRNAGQFQHSVPAKAGVAYVATLQVNSYDDFVPVPAEEVCVETEDRIPFYFHYMRPAPFNADCLP